MNGDILVRPVRMADLAGLYALAEASGTGFTTLQANKDFLANKIAGAERSFDHDPGSLVSGCYFFVAEHLPSGKLVGTTAIAENVGESDVFYSFKVSLISKQSAFLNVRADHQVLSVSSDYKGAAELCSLFLLPGYRADFTGQLLSRCRYLFMADFPGCFNPLVIAEMRGVCDEAGVSPFWEALGKRFFTISFNHADYLVGIGHKQFISDLLPSMRILVSMLPEAAQAVIGEVHSHTRPAAKLLEREGFMYRGYVDIFDAGPTLEARREHIKTIQDSAVQEVVAIEKNISGGQPAIVSNQEMDFRCLVCDVLQQDHGVALGEQQARRLGVEIGSTVRLVAVNQGAK